MKTSFWTPYISDHTIKAICWTLIHSLWIGLAIALLSGLVITITRKSGAALRYNLLCGILMLFTIAVYVTFCIEMWTPAIAQGPFHIGQVIYAPDNHIIIIPTATQHVSLLSRTIWLLNEYSNVIFMAWLLFFVFKSLKMAGGLLYIQRIRTYKVHEVADELKHKIEMFASQIGIRRTVCLVQSELVKVPVAMGWLKPVILLPMGIVLQLSPGQLESILWHELAHIRRQDYLVNILQGLVETVFFFNPGLLWLSSLIRAEREACCDDVVLSRMNHKANYLEALLAFGNEDNSRISLAMGIGSGNQLRDRLKRMVDKENKRLSMAEKVVLIVGLVALSAFTGLPKTTQNAVKHLVDVVTKAPGHKDSIKSKITTSDSATKQTREFRQIEVISGDTLHRKTDTAITFVSVLFKNSDADLANNDINAKDDKGTIYHFIVADNKLVAMEINGGKVRDNDLPNYQYMITQIDIAVFEKRHIRETDMARFKANQPNAKFKADRRFDKRLYVDSMRSADTKVMNDIIADLVAHKVVNNASDVKWFALTNTEFIVNGQKQPNETQQRYKAKYGANEGWGFYYGPVPMKGKGVFIDPEGMVKEQRLSDSIRFGLVKAKFGTGDERRVLKLQMMRQRLHDDSGNYLEQKDRALGVIADLVHDKAVADPASVKWFGLSNTEFIVNGQKQPDELQQKYKAKYGIYDGNGLYYGPVQMHGKGVFIDADPSIPPLPPRPRQPKTPPEPRSGYAHPKYPDTNALKNEQLIKQQQAFAADEGKKRAQLIKQQQAFSADQAQKRNQIIKQQQAYSADQAKKREEIMRQQQLLLADQQKRQGFNVQEYKARFGGMRIELQNIMANVTDDLVSANVLSDKSELVKFNLTNSVLMVNGKKQSEELHEKLKAKYLEQANYKFDPGFMADPNFGLHYNTHNGAMGLGITSGPDSP